MSRQRAPSSSSSSSPLLVYTPRRDAAVSLPARAIHHLPPAPTVYGNGDSTVAVGSARRLILCANYDVANPSASCPMGFDCQFVHADLSLATEREQSVHVNYAWRSIEDVSYERLPEGRLLRVAPPNSKVAIDAMDSALVLKTRAYQSTRRPLSHCAHYYFNRTCNLGPDCQFVHAVFIDPNAKPGQRAPVPSQLGEGRELQLSKKQREALRMSDVRAPSSVDSVAVAPRTTTTYSSPPTNTSVAAAGHPSSSSRPAAGPPDATKLKVILTVAVATPTAAKPRQTADALLRDADAASNAAPATIIDNRCCACIAAEAARRCRFRYNPYLVRHPKAFQCNGFGDAPGAALTVATAGSW